MCAIYILCNYSSVQLFNQVTHSGLILNLLGGFEGSADILHLPNCGVDVQDLEETYPKKKKVITHNKLLNINSV